MVGSTKTIIILLATALILFLPFSHNTYADQAKPINQGDLQKYLPEIKGNAQSKIVDVKILNKPNQKIAIKTVINVKNPSSQDQVIEIELPENSQDININY